MMKAKEYIKGCILGSAMSLILEIYNYYQSASEIYVFLSILASTSLMCSIVVLKSMNRETD
jgi:hypothetical protein